jgi:uncharacterized low-complexity protein
MKKLTLKPVAAALGTTFAVSLAASPIASAADNPFSLTELGQGYMVAGHDGGDKDAEGKCGDKKDEGKGDQKDEGEGKCGGSKDDAEGKCGAA